jgi:O-antigen/teichoic acid export membrane protein
MTASATTLVRRVVPEGLSGLTSNNTSVLVGSMVVTNTLRFAANLVLTRLLVPEAFGVMLVITSVSYIAVLFSETGVAPYLIRTPGAARRRVLDVLWTVQVLRGALLTVLLFACAPLIADALGKPEAMLPLQVASVTLFLDGLRSLRPMVVRREGYERKNALVEMSTYLATLPILLGLALWLESYWALVISMIVGQVITTAASYLLYRNTTQRFAWDGKVIASLWRFMRFILASSMITAIVMQFDKIFVAGAFTLREAGLYAMAWNLALVADTISVSYFHRVYFPEASARLRSERPSPSAFYDPMRFVRPLIVFASAGGVTFGVAFFDIAFDPDYITSGAYFSVLAIKPLLASYAHASGNFLTATGRTRPTFVSNVIRLVYLPAAAILGYQHFGVFGLLWAVALIDLLPAAYQYVAVARLGVVRLRSELPALLAIPAGLASGALMTEAWQVAAPLF